MCPLCRNIRFLHEMVRLTPSHWLWILSASEATCAERLQCSLGSTASFSDGYIMFSVKALLGHNTKRPDRSMEQREQRDSLELGTGKNSREGWSEEEERIDEVV